MSGLPGQGGEPYRKIEGKDYQDLAMVVARTIYGVCHMIHKDQSQRADEESGDGGPIIQGALTGIMMFAFDGEITDEELRKQLLDGIDAMMPQLRMTKAAAGLQGGTA